MSNFFKSKFYLLIIIFFYVGTNFLFNFYVWQQLILKELPDRIGIFGEWPIYEYVAETIRKNILSGKNPFSDITQVLYPFGWNFALEDMSPINGFYFLFTRPFFTVHQSFAFIVLFSIFVSNISMYMLLRRLTVSKRTSFIMSLVFGYAPFMVIRFGHPTYLALYLFSLFFLFALCMKETKNKKNKVFWAFLLGIICCVSVLTNLYYTLMIAFLCFSFSIFLLIFDRVKLLRGLRQLFPWVFISLGTIGFLLFPWFMKVHESFLFGYRVYAVSFIDSITYSADLISIFMPGSANPIYGEFFQFITLHYMSFMKPSFENFIYPGFLILGTYFYFIFYKKQITQSVIKKMWPFFVISIFFWILALGPFLHILGRKFPIPLPYLVLHITPYFNMARSPGRFIVPFIFLATIIAAFVIDDVAKNKLKVKISRNLFFLNLILIFFLDQSYTAVLPMPNFRVLTPKIYTYIQSHGKGPLLEVPFSVRDGLRFQGDYNSIWLPTAQLKHGQKIFSLYGGRIRDDIFDYYKNDPLFGSIDRLINKPNKQEKTITEKAQKEITRSLEFFDIHYILLKTDEVYSKTAYALFSHIGFQKVMEDHGYLLLYKKNEEYSLSPSKIDLESKHSDLYLTEGWTAAEPTGRWVVGKRARMLFKTNNTSSINVQFRAYTLVENQKMEIYINKSKTTEILLQKDPKTYSFVINTHMVKGINRLVFKFSDTIKPADVFPKNLDKRDLSAFLYTVSFQDSNSL